MWRGSAISLTGCWALSWGSWCCSAWQQRYSSFLGRGPGPGQAETTHMMTPSQRPCAPYCFYSADNCTYRWLSWGVFFDPGTQTSVAADEKFEVKVVAAAFSVMGFIFNLVLLGIIVDVCHTSLVRQRTLRARSYSSGHTLVLGWTDRTIFLLTELCQCYGQDSVKSSRREIQVMADVDSVVMEAELLRAVPESRRFGCTITCW